MKTTIAHYSCVKLGHALYASPLAVTGWNLVMIQGVINKGAIFFGAWDRTWKPCGRSEPRQDKRITWRGNK